MSSSPTSTDTSAMMDALREVQAELQTLQARIGVPISKPAYLEMPPEGLPLNALGWQAIGNTGTTVAVVTIQVPGGMNGVIKWIGNSYLGPEFVEGTGNVIWQLWEDGNPMPDFDDILGSLGSPSSPSETAPIRIYESRTYQLVLINVSIANGGQLLGGRLSGWYYPVDYDSQTSVEEPDEPTP